MMTAVDLDQAIHEQVIAAYRLFANHTDDDEKAREYLERADAMEAAGVTRYNPKDNE